MYVDGGNFHHLVLKKLRSAERRFAFSAFIRFLAGDRAIVRMAYYTGTVRERVGDERSRDAMANQARFFTALAKEGWDIETSKLRRRQEAIPIDDRVTDFQALQAAGFTEISYERDREKGIDVKMAVDLLMDAQDDAYDTAILISSDADLLPAVSCVRSRFNKKVEYVGFSLRDDARPTNSTKPLLTFMKNTDVQRTLAAVDLAPFLRRAA